ncbi:MAG TPA: transposase [Firmicutes bacterium]|nr:transposase [Bacillota bacterium]
MTKKQTDKPKKQYRTYAYRIKQSHPLFSYCDTMCLNAKNMYNVTQFHIRQVMTGVQKDKACLSENEKHVFATLEQCLVQLNEIQETTYEKKCQKAVLEEKDLPKKPTPHQMPTTEKWFLTYGLLDGMFKLSNNADYRSLPTQTSQAMIKLVLQDWTSYFESIKDFKHHSSKYLGRPNLPRYAKKNGRKVATFTNQDAVIRHMKESFTHHELKLPKTKLTLPLGDLSHCDTTDLKEVRIVPKGTDYVIELVCQLKHIQTLGTKETATRIASIDLGVSNFVTMSNNIGEAPILVKGGILKNKNQFYNQQRAHYYGILRLGKSPKEEPFTSKRLNALDRKRHDFMKDYFHKVSKQLVMYCLDHQIDTLVIGKNDGWKQHVNFKKKDKQNFIHIPYNVFIQTLTYKAEQAGIFVVETEESYTSKASFLDRDALPIYQENNTTKYTFSGYRVKRSWYQSKQHGRIHADVNGAANIQRKVFPQVGDSHVWDTGVLKTPIPLSVSYASKIQK